MIVKQYRFADVTFRLLSPETMIEDPMFEIFADKITAESDYIFEIFTAEPEKKPTAAEPMILERTGNHLKAYMDTSLLPKINVAQFLSGAKADKLLPERNRVMLHCAYVLHEGKALLFCAPSGTGKSTQADFWNRVQGSATINEDRAIIGKADGTYYAHGCWAMGHGNVCRNVSAPIRAIVLLGQGKKNHVYRLHAVDAITRIIPQCSFDDQSNVQCQKIIEIVADMISGIPVWGYDCINNESSVEELEKYL